MKRKGIMAGSVLVTLTLGIGWLAARGKAGNAPAPSTETARPQVELTVYPQGFGMVSEVRPMTLAAGSNRLRLREVSKQMDPESVLLQWQGDSPELPQLVAHSYDLGVADADGLLNRYLGQQVEVIRYGNDGHEAERQKGTLMVESGGNVVLQTDGSFYIHPPGTIVAPAGGNIVTIPQLSVQADSATAQTANLELAYLTSGLSWSADYVATLSRDDRSLALECWATVTNRTGVDYPNAKVALSAGTPNRAVVPAATPAHANGLMMEAKTPMVEAAGGPAGPRPQVAAPEAVGEGYLYRIKNPTTVVQEQMNRLLMLSSGNVTVKKDYNTRPPQLSAWGDEGWSSQPSQRGSVAAALTFYNREKDGLGQPLPAGAIRVYEPDSSGSLRYAGADSIQNTPKDQKVNLTLASAFDVFTEWRLVKTQKVNKHTRRKQVELILHNEKAAPINLRVVQEFSGRWKIAAESHPHANLDASDAQWTVPVPAGGQTTLRFTVDLAI
ncbi:MAG TPA: DUF4139 domain-containing protein [Chthonomonadaceae bacterium]|nr:DUF4139 domain-containing protein [Chthonomonadaceae bacterium]